MPLQDRIKGLVDKAEAKIRELTTHSEQGDPNPQYGQQQQYPPQQQPGGPPPIPFSSKPDSSSLAPQSDAYWQPSFQANTPVSQHFIHKEGQHGWGNNELQNYTSNPENAFFTPNGTLVLRAIATSSAPTQEQKFTSARLVSRQKLDRERGYLHVRLTSPCAKGVWPAFWLLPEEPFSWPGDGEVDIFEAWNAEKVNHSCLHWGHFNGEDWNKHWVVETPIPKLDHPNGREYGFAWEGGSRKLVWYVDGKAVMKSTWPQGTRRLQDLQVLINIALGGNVCQGVQPKDGVYELVVHELKMCENPPGGWGRFEGDWRGAAEGHH